MIKLNRWITNGILAFSMIASVSVNAHNIAKEEIAVQMYTLRDVGTLEEQFSMAHRAGFKSIELVGTQGVDRYELSRLLHEYQLKPMGAHVQLSELRTNIEYVISFNQSIGNSVIIMPWIAAEDRPTSADGWRNLGEELNDIGQVLRKQGMKLAYHNHDFEMKKYDGKLALEWILKSSNSKNLQLELDAAWVSRGGQDPVSFIKKWKKRIFSLHVKDNSGIGTHDNEANFTVAGQGIMAWDDILYAAQKAHIQWFVVEHDLPYDAENTITEANQYLLNRLF